MSRSSLVLVGLLASLGAVEPQEREATAELKPAFSISISMKQTTFASAPVKARIAAWNDHRLGPQLPDVSIVFTNASDHKLNLPWVLGVGQNYRIDVRDSENRKPQAARPGMYSGGSGTFLHQEPGQSVKEDYPVWDVYDLSKPGRYSIQVSRLDRETNIRVKSNTITITVTP